MAKGTRGDYGGDLNSCGYGGFECGGFMLPVGGGIMSARFIRKGHFIFDHSNQESPVLLVHCATWQAAEYITILLNLNDIGMEAPEHDTVH